MHHIFKLIKDGKLFEASVPKTVQRVLDLGCVSMPKTHVQSGLVLKSLRALESGQWISVCGFLRR